MLTLVFVPAMYTVFDDIQAGVLRLLGHRPTPPTQHARPLPVAGGSGDDEVHPGFVQET
jgi:hypothetical protein